MYEELEDIIKFYKNTKYAYNKKISENEVNRDKMILRDCVLDVFQIKHPLTYLAIKRTLLFELQCAAEFISKFYRIFTLSYDLLLYWLILYHKENVTNHPPFKDGFSIQISDNLIKINETTTDYNVHFLHGAIHLIEREGRNKDIDPIDTLKIKRKNTDKIPLKEVISAIKKEKINMRNLMIFEGSSQNKLKIICRNSYLKKCLARLKNLNHNNDLYIYGCSIINQKNEINNDSHIWSAIINSKVNNIFISINNNTTSKEFMQKSEYITKALNDLCEENKNIYFYSSKECNIWKFSDGNFKE